MTSAEIKKRREEKGLTQEDLAKLIGVSRVTVARWETDKTKPLPIFLQILGKKLKKKKLKKVHFFLDISYIICYNI